MSDAVAEAFVFACEDEIAALKPGNVHVHAAGHGMTAADFRLSAVVAAPALCARGAPLGARVLDAVRATRAAVGRNTNLGILLLCAPLAVAAEAGGPLRSAVRTAIDAAGVADAAQVFEAIVLASPGGLGEASRHDVRRPATVTLREAMAEAAPRDRIARQYATGFADIFEDGVPGYARAMRRWGDPAWAAAGVYLHHLAASPDSHVRRKLGDGMAEEVRREAAWMKHRFDACSHPEDLRDELLGWDASLKRHRINPGTCADLTVATIMACRLRPALLTQSRSD